VSTAVPAVQLVGLRKAFGDVVADDRRLRGADRGRGAARRHRRDDRSAVRPRRQHGVPGSFAEASADLGADPAQTFRLVTFPLVRSALAAGGLLAFALSFDEIIVTTFTAGAGIETLPQWILNNFSRPNSIPLVNVVATVVMLLSIPLAWLAQRLSDGAEALGGGR
jgi:Binding-protein-dependent transport system inner membrane component